MWLVTIYEIYYYFPLKKLPAIIFFNNYIKWCKSVTAQEYKRCSLILIDTELIIFIVYLKMMFRDWYKATHWSFSTLSKTLPRVFNRKVKSPVITFSIIQESIHTYNYIVRVDCSYNYSTAKYHNCDK